MSLDFLEYWLLLEKKNKISKSKMIVGYTLSVLLYAVASFLVGYYLKLKDVGIYFPILILFLAAIYLDFLIRDSPGSYW